MFTFRTRCKLRGLAGCSVMPANEAMGTGEWIHGRMELYLQQKGGQDPIRKTNSQPFLCIRSNFPFPSARHAQLHLSVSTGNRSRRRREHDS